MVSWHSLHSRITKSCFGLPCQVRGQCTAAEHARDTLQQTIRELECQRIEEASRSRERDRVQEAELKQARLDLARLSATGGRLRARCDELTKNNAVLERELENLKKSRAEYSSVVAPDPTPENAELAVVEQDLSSALVAKDFKLAKKLKVRRDELRKIVSAEVHVPSTSLLPTASSTVEVKATQEPTSVATPASEPVVSKSALSTVDDVAPQHHLAGSDDPFAALSGMLGTDYSALTSSFSEGAEENPVVGAGGSTAADPDFEDMYEAFLSGDGSLN